MAQAERVASGVRKMFFGKSALADVRLSRVTPLGVEGQEICLEGEEWDLPLEEERRETFLEGKEGEGGAEARRLRSGAKLQLRRVTVRLGFVGEHNAMNAAAAAASGTGALHSHSKKSPAVSLRLRPYSHRSRLVAGAGGITILDDCYNASPTSMEAALATLAGLRVSGSGRAIAVLGDMLELGAAEEEEHRKLGRKARAAGIAVAAFFGPRSSLTFKEFSSSSSSSSSPSAHFTEIEPLLAWLRAHLQPGDTVLVKGSRGMKLERVVDALSKEAS